MPTVYCQDNYIAEVKVLDYYKDKDGLGGVYVVEVIQTIENGWFGSLPDGKVFSFWQSSNSNLLGSCQINFKRKEEDSNGYKKEV